MYHRFIFFLNAGGARDARKIFFIILYPWKCFSNFLLHLHWNVLFFFEDQTSFLVAATAPEVNTSILAFVS